MRPLCFFLPLMIHAAPLDTDGDGWPEAEERAKGFDIKSAASHPPAPRYAPVDLGPVSAHGMPVAISATRHRVLTDKGRRWSWSDGWEALVPPPDSAARFDLIRADGAVLGRVEQVVDGMPVGEVWSWDAAGQGGPVEGTRYSYLVPSDPADCPWEFQPLRWLRGDDFLVRAVPITLEPAPIPCDVLVVSLGGAPRPSRRLANGEVVADGSGGRWVRPVVPDSAVPIWRLEGAGRVAELGPDLEPLAFSDDGALLSRFRTRLHWHASLQAEPTPLDGDAVRLALTCNDAGEPVAVELGHSSRLWSLGAPGPCDRLADLVDNEEPWLDFAAVATDDHGAILAVGSRIRADRLRRDANGIPLKEGMAPSDCESRIVLLVPLRVRCDHDRAVDNSGLRGRFPMDDTGGTPAARPLRLWLNDDHDDGELTDDPDSDLPGAILASPPNFQRLALGGRCDLIDWFPVCLRLGAAASDLPPFQIRLISGPSLVSALETSLPVARAAQYLQRDFGAVHGHGLNQDIGSAVKSPAGSGGIVLSAAFSHSLVGPRLLGEGEATLLLEGRTAGAATLWVCLVREGVPADRMPGDDDILLRAPLRIMVAPVESFYRQWDARHPGLSSSIEPPAFPDSLSPGPWVVFTHGFNVDARAGRAWGAEIFKRLHQAGSRGRFVAFRWFGDQGSANYGMAVECAPAAADRLAEQVRSLERMQPGQPWVLVGHSLGTYVTVLAGRERLVGSADIRQLVLLNAALPAEALDARAQDRCVDYAGGEAATAAALMLPHSGPWRATAPWSWPESRASAWAGLYPDSDLRAGCTWRGRLVGDAPVLNLYSRTEDVLMPAPADAARWPGLIAAADHGAWIYQETHKGRWMLEAVNPAHAQGGWALASASRLRAQRLLLAGTGPRRITLLRTDPLFSSFRLDAVLTSAAVGPRSPGSCAVARRLSATAGWGAKSTVPRSLTWTVRDELLAHAIPALSNPAGSVPVAGAENFRMDGAEAIDPPCGELRPFPLGWPRGVELAPHLTASAYVWRHSDWKNVAYPYVYPVFAHICLSAGLSRTNP
ncbi:MAG: alpha/beta hydrolase [Opitutales bacterium]